MVRERPRAGLRDPRTYFIFTEIRISFYYHGVRTPFRQYAIMPRCTARTCHTDTRAPTTCAHALIHIHIDRQSHIEDTREYTTRTPTRQKDNNRATLSDTDMRHTERGTRERVGECACWFYCSSSTIPNSNSMFTHYICSLSVMGGLRCSPPFAGSATLSRP